MAIIALPAGIRFLRRDLSPVANVQVNRSQWSKSRKVFDLDNGYYRGACVAIANTEAKARTLRAFHAQLRDSANSFRLPVSDCPQLSADLTANGAAAAGVNSFNVQGPADLVVPAGVYLTAVFSADHEQIFTTTGSVTLNGGGLGTVFFDMGLRQLLPAAGTILAQQPRALVALTEGAGPPETVEGVTRWTFEVEEAFDGEAV